MTSHNAPSLFVLVKFARRMRREPTRSEAMLWAALRKRQLGVHFRRQHPLGEFIVDFYCATHRLVVEVDGGVHREQQEHDALRQQTLERFFGVRFVRLPVAVVERDVAAAVAFVRDAL